MAKVIPLAPEVPRFTLDFMKALLSIPIHFDVIPYKNANPDRKPSNVRTPCR